MNFIKISVLSILTLVMCCGVGICATPLLPEGGVGYTVSAGTMLGHYSYTITEDGSYYITTDSKFTGNININNTLQSVNIDGNNLISPTQSITYDNAQSFTNSLIVNNITLNSISFKSQNGAHGSGGGGGGGVDTDTTAGGITAGGLGGSSGSVGQINIYIRNTNLSQVFTQITYSSGTQGLGGNAGGGGNYGGVGAKGVSYNKNVFSYMTISNNILNSTHDYSELKGWQTVRFYESPTAATNIVGGNYTAGNYWTTEDQNGFSDQLINQSGTLNLIKYMSYFDFNSNPLFIKNAMLSQYGISTQYRDDLYPLIDPEKVQVVSYILHSPKECEKSIKR